MPDDRKKTLEVRPDRPEPADAVGYGKPPAHSRFRKGQSGNPRGRPKGSKNRRQVPGTERLQEIVLEEAYRDVSVHDGTNHVTVPMAQAVIRALAVNAVKGQHRALKLFTEMLSATERQKRELHDRWLQTAIEYKVEWERELARREQLGLQGPDPLPHPDHVIIDLRSNTAVITGPATKEEKRHYEWWVERKRLLEQERDELRTTLARARKPERKQVCASMLADTEQTLEQLNDLLEGGGWSLLHAPDHISRQVE